MRMIELGKDCPNPNWQEWTMARVKALNENTVSVEFETLEGDRIAYANGNLSAIHMEPSPCLFCASFFVPESSFTPAHNVITPEAVAGERAQQLLGAYFTFGKEVSSYSLLRLVRIRTFFDPSNEPWYGLMRQDGSSKWLTARQLRRYMFRNDIMDWKMTRSPRESTTQQDSMITVQSGTRKRKKEWKEEDNNKKPRRSSTTHQAWYVYKNLTDHNHAHRRGTAKALKRALSDPQSTGNNSRRSSDNKQTKVQDAVPFRKQRVEDGTTLVNVRKTPEERQKICIEKQAAELRAQVGNNQTTSRMGDKQPILWELFSGGCSISTAFEKENWRCFKLEIDTTLAYETGATADSIQHHYQSGGFDRWVEQAGGELPDAVHASPPCRNFSFAVPPEKRDYDEGLKLVFYFYLTFIRYAKESTMFTFEQPMNQLMRMPCTAMLRYTRWAHCAYGMLWKKPSCFYHSVGGEGLPLKTCPHEPSWKHPRALGKKMSSAWNKKRYKSAIPTLRAPSR